MTLRFEKIMQLRGAYLPAPLTPAVARDVAAARQRCLQCRQTKLCDELLATGSTQGYGLFCPNTHYIEHLRGSALRFS